MLPLDVGFAKLAVVQNDEVFGSGLHQYRLLCHASLAAAN
jgi:hypothetical protein